MANSSHPRKFSEKMAVLNQRQAIYTAETEGIIREVTELRKVFFIFIFIQNFTPLNKLFVFSTWKRLHELVWDPMVRPLRQRQVELIFLPVPAVPPVLLATEHHLVKTSTFAVNLKFFKILCSSLANL